MKPTETKHRDRVLRAYVEGRTWDNEPGSEFNLVRKLVMQGHPLLEPFPYLVDYEWEVEGGFSDEGRGDLVFSDGQGNYATVEVKVVQGGRRGGSGSTTRNARRKKRRKVEAQAWDYALVWQKRQEDARTTKSFLYTNELELFELGVVNDEAGEE